MAKSLKQLFSCIALFPHFQMNLSTWLLKLSEDEFRRCFRKTQMLLFDHSESDAQRQARVT